MSLELLSLHKCSLTYRHDAPVMKDLTRLAVCGLPSLVHFHQLVGSYGTQKVFL